MRYLKNATDVKMRGSKRYNTNEDGNSDHERKREKNRRRTKHDSGNDDSDVEAKKMNL